MVGVYLFIVFLALAFFFVLSHTWALAIVTGVIALAIGGVTAVRFRRWGADT